MNKYRVFRILNSKGESVGKQDFYTTIGKAKCGARHCTWRLDPGSKIVELEVVETPVNETSINLVETIGYNNHKYFRIKDYGNEKFPTQETQSELIKFN